jgi:peptide/nickel transport system permease protein
MGSYLLRRSIWFALTLLAISFVVFISLNVLPGDPARLVVGLEASPVLYAKVRAELGLDRPWPLRYLDWLGGVLRGDLGRSLHYRRPVGELLGDALSVSFPLALLAFSLSLLIALPLGALAARRRGGLLDVTLMGLAQAGLAVPEFWLGFVLILAFSVGLRSLPAGWFPGWEAGLSALKYLVLPALALAVPRGAYLARMVRGALLSTLGEAYVSAARAKGLSEAKVVWVHALRPALIPVVTSGGIIFGRLLAGTIVVENIFYLPGLGRLALVSVLARDIPLVQGVVLVAAGSILAMSFLADLSYGLLDPRVHYR